MEKMEKIDSNALLTAFFLFLAAGVIAYLIFSGLWWIVLWSFNFIIPFSWTQPIGLMLMSSMMSSGEIASYTKTIRKAEKSMKEAKKQKNKKDLNE